LSAGDVRRKPGLWGLISSRFEYFLAFFVVALSISVIVVALLSQPSPSQPVIQGMTAIVSGVIGFYFGNKGVERAEERVKEVENQLATGLGPSAIQRGRIDEELEEIHKIMKDTRDQAYKASELHQKNQKKEADLFFRNAKEYNERSCNGMNAWIEANYAWLKLDEDAPSYEDILDMFKKSKKYREQADTGTRTGTDFGIAIALIWTIPRDQNRKEEAIHLLNGIASEIDGMKDLYELGDLKERDVDKFLEVESRLVEKVVKYLKEAKSYYNKKK